MNSGSFKNVTYKYYFTIIYDSYMSKDMTLKNLLNWIAWTRTVFDIETVYLC